jgi:tetratricopeptide (TPR) repeat protein
MGDLHRRMGDVSIAADLINQSIVLAGQRGDNLRLAWSVFALGEVETERGNYARAIELYEQAQELDRQRGNEYQVVELETWIAANLASSGRAPEAARRLHSISADVLRLSDQSLSSNMLAAHAHVCAALGDAERAARLLGAHWAHYARKGAPVEPVAEEAWLQRIGLAAVRDTLGQQRWEQALDVGAGYSLEEALADAEQATTQN